MMQVVWHGERSWGNESYRHLLTGTMYRRARRRETPDLVEPTLYGDVGLRKLNRKERQSLEEDIERSAPRRRKGRKKP